METYRPPAKVTPQPQTLGAPLMWVKVGLTEQRPDGSSVERFRGGQSATRELLRVPPTDHAAILFQGPARAWTGASLPAAEREVHTEYRTLIVREPQKALMWRQNLQGTIMETPVTINPLLGPPKQRVIERLGPDGQENPEWTRLNLLLSTPL